MWCVTYTQHMFDRFVRSAAGHTNALSFIFLSESRALFKFVILVIVVVA